MTASAAGGGRLLTTILIAILANSVLSTGRFAVSMVGLGLGAGEFTVGILTSLFMVVPITTTVLLGRWMDRVGLVAPMKVAITLSVLSGVVSAVMPGIPSLAVTAVLAGAGGVFSHVASIKAVGSVGDADTRMRMLGRLAVCYSVMQFISPLLVGFAYEHAGARVAFSVLGLLPLAAMLLFAGGGHLYLAEAPNRPGPAGGIRDGGPVLSDARLRSWVLTYAVFQAALTLYPVVIALYGASVGLGAAAISGLLAAQAVGAILSRGTVAVVKAAISKAALVAAALVVAAGAYGALPLFQTWPPLAVASALVGAAAGLGQPVALSMVYETAPPHRVNEAISFASISANVLQLVMPFVAGGLAALFGLGVMAVLLALSLLGALGLRMATTKGLD